MSTDARTQLVGDACAALLAEGQRITFDNVAGRTGLGRATPYRNTTVIEEHRVQGREAGTLTGLTTDSEHLRIALDALATKVRIHEEELRKLRRNHGHP